MVRKPKVLAAHGARDAGLSGEVLRLRERPQSLGEEIANSVSHGLGLLAALAAFPVLVIVAHQRGDAAGIAGASVFATTMVLLYLTSTLFHALPGCRAKRVFQILDHSAIYLLIAGTYTPFTLGVLRGAWGWTLFGLVWGLAVVGTVLKAVGGVRYTTVSTWVYLAMGWLILIAAEPAWTLVPKWGLFWLLAGGFAYTAGAVFFMAERIRYFHFVWHLFVVAGTACHFVAVLRYAA
jgi:hemolysin III